MGWYRRLLRFALRHPGSLAWSIAGAGLGMAGQLVIPLLERAVLDRIVDHRAGPILPLLAGMLAIGVGFAISVRVRFYYAVRIAILVLFDLRVAVHRQVLDLDRAALDEYGPGQLLERFTSDSTDASNIFYFTSFRIQSGLLLVLSTAVMVALSVWLGLVTFLILCLLMVLSWRFRTRAYGPSLASQQREGELLQLVDEDVAGVQVVKAFGQEQAEVRRVAGACDAIYDAQMEVVSLQSRYQPLLSVLPVLGQGAVLGLGGWLALRHRITLGTFLACSTYMAMLVGPVQSLAGMITIVQEARAGAVRVFDLLDRRPRLRDDPDAGELHLVRGDVAFQGVGFGYEEATPVLHDLDLHIPPGTCVAVVGPSGSGKSTLLDLLLRFYDPQQGQILVDGQDIKDVRLDSLRRCFGVVFEDSFLFAGTVRDNIAYGRPDADQAAIEAAARAAQAHDFITSLPNGYDTVVGERGVRLSGGQRQRVALARALVTDARILVLDDATSAVDVLTERRIHAALRQRADRTVVMAASRRSSAELADTVVVLDAGRVVDVGPHARLMQHSPRYRRLMHELDEETVEREAARLSALPAGPSSSDAWPEHAASDGAGPSRSHVATPAGDGDRLGVGGARFGLRAVLVPFARPLLVGLLLVALDAVAGVVGPSLIRVGLNHGVLAGSGRVLAGATAVYLLVAVADALVQGGSTLVIGRTARRIMRWLRLVVWGRLQGLSLDFYERERTGHLTTHMTTDVDQIRSLIEQGLLPAVVSVVTAVGVAVVMVAVSPLLAVCAGSVLLPLAVLTRIVQTRLHHLFGISRDMEGEMAAFFRDGVAGIRECQTYGHQQLTRDQWQELGLRYSDSRYVSARMIGNFDALINFLAMAAVVIVLGVGGHLLRSGELRAGTLIAFILYVGMLFSPIIMLIGLAGSWQQTRVAINRIAGVMSTSTRTPEVPDAVPAPTLVGDLGLEQVGFAYGEKGPAALDGVDLGIRAGETVAVVGETGAGKSTMMKLLLRLYDPDHGQVTADERDIRTLTLASYRRQVGYVPQDGFIFTGTVRDNIAYGRDTASDAEVEAAARTVGAHDFICQLPAGYREPLQGGGRSLSAGHRQLIALARAELIEPRILLLDEATAKLDLTAEVKVAVGMRRASRNRTTILIAHRLQTARSADRIVVMDHGRVAEIGSHEDLLARGGRYAELWEVTQGVAT